MRKGKGLLMGALCALAIGAAVVGCSTVVKGIKTTAHAAYTVASAAVEEYCALPQSTRAAGQLVLVGKVYNSGLCDVVNGDTDLKAKLATASAQEVNTLIAAKVDTALATGAIDKSTAQQILSGDTASSTAAVEAVDVTAKATETTKAAAIVIDPTPETASGTGEAKAA
ncbi:hypothetical protein ACIPL1_27645 [Pseudomonas sp. NPDC090202]|uniref:hypothetical protein n=1 Tax=Pseudomonas sp. NPDC090202 TaxID=3364476 RepID=UPI0037FC9B71